MKCFVIMPFGDSQKEPEKARTLNLIYNDWIKSAVESIKVPNRENEKIICHRADKSARPGEIITHVIENLVLSDIVIADLSGRNPNVFYELGVRHSVNNNTILIADNLEDVPFDLRGLRTITYKYEPEQMLKLQKSIKEAIKEIIKEPDKLDNPVRRYLYNQEVDKLLKQTAPPGYDIIKNILSEMSNLKKSFSEQTTEIKKILNQITTSRTSNFNDVNTAEDKLAFFEGIWFDEMYRGNRYAKIINNELRIPYLYANSPSNPAHFYNCTLIGDTLFARFEWFHEKITGYAFLIIVTKNKLEGGWWYKHYMPKEISKDITLIKETIPGMKPMSWKRIKEKKAKPPWIQEYFEHAEKDSLDLLKSW